MEIYEKGLGLNFCLLYISFKAFWDTKIDFVKLRFGPPPHTAFLLLPSDRRWMSECATIGGVLYTLEIKCNVSKINIKNKMIESKIHQP